MESGSPDYSFFYFTREPLYARLKEEVEFATRKAIEEAAIKINQVTGRVKEFSHFTEKIERKRYTSPEQVRDVVGLRVVCLFLSDIDRISELIKKIFMVVEEEDKIEGVRAPESFGYMSKHFICKMRSDITGPRYDDLKGLEFEIQIRTILMDAWANVSHHLSYKGELNIPSRLLRDFHALSGMLYVADQHFQLIFRGALDQTLDMEPESAVQFTDVDPMPVAGIEDAAEVNGESISIIFRQLYPDRERSDEGDLHEFAEKIATLGYQTIGNLRQTLIGAQDAALRYEAENPPGDIKGARFADIGIARQALAIASPDFAQQMYPGEYDLFAEYR